MFYNQVASFQRKPQSNLRTRPARISAIDIRNTHISDMHWKLREWRFECDRCATSHHAGRMEYIGDWKADNGTPVAVYECPNCGYREFLAWDTVARRPFCLWHNDPIPRRSF